MNYFNHYECVDCGTFWTTRWNSMGAAGKCLTCGKAYTPVESEAIIEGDYAQCQRCDRKWDEEDLNKINELNERVYAGDPFPAGQCPDCGALCYLIEYHSGEGRCADPSCKNDCQRGSAERIQQGDTPAPSPQLWLYRTEEFDDEGDPFDWGVIKADSIEQITQSLTQRFAEYALSSTFTVMLHPVTGYDELGLPITHETTLVKITTPDEDDQASA